MLAPFCFGIQFVADIDPILRETALLTFRDIIFFGLDAIIKHCCFLLEVLRGLHIRSADILREWLKNAQYSALFKNFVTNLVTDFWV